MLSKWSRKKKAGIVIAAVLIVAAGVCIYGLQDQKSEETSPITKETKAEYGNLTTGITESGNVTINSLTQSFSLEFPGSSESSSNTTSSGSSSNMAASFGNVAGGMSMTTGASQTQSGNSAKSSGNSQSTDTSLVVEKVYVTNGQSVKKGDRLLKLTKESVEEVRALYQENYEEAEEALADAKLTYRSGKLTAEYTYKQTTAKGKSAKNTYDATVATLSANVSTAKAAYQEAKNGVETLPSQIKALKKRIKAAKNAKKGAVALPETNKQTEEVENVTGSENASVLSQSEQELLSKQQQLKQYQANLRNLKAAWHAAKKALSTGKIEAEAVYKQTKIDCENAKAVYQTEMSSLKEDWKSAKSDFEEAKEAKTEFEEYVKNRIIKAEYSGTLVSVGYEEGDSLSTDTDIAAYQDLDGVTILVSVTQEDIVDIQIGDSVNVSLSAYEDEIFKGNVTSVSTTASEDSTVSYAVEVTITSDVSKIYSGMSGEVTFVSEEVQNVLYVSGKAVRNEGDDSYVILKKEDGTTQKTKVTTGFTDGRNIEIVSGLSEGDIVLIESQVSQ